MTAEALFLNPLGPALVLLLGGLITTFGRQLTYRARLRAGQYGLSSDAVRRFSLTLVRLRLPFALVMLLAAAALHLRLRLDFANALRWDWQPLTVAGSVWEWRLDGWNWLVAALILLLTGVALLLTPPETSARNGNGTRYSPRLDQQGVDTERTLWLAAAAWVFVCSGNVLTLASSWIVLDAALSFRLRPSSNPGPAGRAWALLSLAALLLVLALALLGESDIRAPLTQPGMLAVLWLLALIRAGVYPLHFWLTGPGRIERGDAVALSLLAPLTGLWLLARLHGIAGPDWLRRPEWAALGAFALLGTALVAWTAEAEPQRWRWIALNRASMVVMAAYTAGAIGPEALVWPVVAFVWGCALLAVAQALRGDGWRLPGWLAALALWGPPGLAGFLARNTLVFPTELPVAAPLFSIVLLAEILLAAALWQAAAGYTAGPALSRGRAGMLAFTFAALFAGSIAWGVAPRGLASLVGWPAGDTFPALADLIAGARRSVWAGLILSGIFGAALGLLRSQIFGQMRGWQRGIAALAGLDWLYRAAAFGYGLAASGLQYFAVLGEGEGYLGWLALAGFILWVLLRG